MKAIDFKCKCENCGGNSIISIMPSSEATYEKNHDLWYFCNCIAWCYAITAPDGRSGRRIIKKSENQKIEKLVNMWFLLQDKKIVIKKPKEYYPIEFYDYEITIFNIEDHMERVCDYERLIDRIRVGHGELLVDKIEDRVWYRTTGSTDMNLQKLIEQFPKEITLLKESLLEEKEYKFITEKIGQFVGKEFLLKKENNKLFLKSITPEKPWNELMWEIP